jgi:hypothetical protein
MRELVIKLLLADKETLGTIRTHETLQVALDGEFIWLWSIESKADIKLLHLPAICTYELDEQGNLFPPGKLTPVVRLKKLSWVPISEFIQVALPTSAMPGQLSRKYRIKLVPSGKVMPGEALLTSLPVWKRYADTAPEVRLKALRFALSANGRALIMGTPLPSIPGKEYWLQDSLLLPAGYDVEIPLISGLIAKKINPENDSFLLFHEDSRWEKISKPYFVPATRSAVRLSGEENE